MTEAKLPLRIAGGRAQLLASYRAGQLPPVETISDETFRKFVAALAGPRDVKRGRELFFRAIQLTLVACKLPQPVGCLRANWLPAVASQESSA